MSDANILNDLMKRTFSIRRTEIVNEPQQILKVYPSLGRYNQSQLAIVLPSSQELMYYIIIQYIPLAAYTSFLVIS